MIEVKKRDNESTENLVRRFTKQVQQSRFLLRIKKSRFYEPPKTKRQIRESAKRRNVIREKRELLRKTGKLDELYDRKKHSPRRTY